MLETTVEHPDTFAAMPASRHRGDRNTAGPAVGVLNDGDYERIRNKPKTFEFHLATALFPRRKITAKAVAKMVSHRIPNSGKYNIIFHLQDDLAHTVAEELSKVWREIPNNAGRLFLVPHHGNRIAAEARTGKIRPQGLVTSAEIDAALAGATSARRSESELRRK